MAGKGGGAWKVAYADFVTAMMAFFMVMWITAQSKDVKTAIAGYFRDPSLPAAHTPGATPPRSRARGGASNLKGPAEGPRARGPALAEPGPKALSDDAPSTDDPSHVLQFPDREFPADGTVLQFPEGVADLDRQAQQRLEQLIPALRGKLNKIEIRGHTSRRPLPADGPFADAWQLSFARCLAAKRFLEQQGIEPERIRMSQAAGYEPCTTQLGAERQARNSRVEVYILADLAESLAARPADGTRVATHP